MGIWIQGDYADDGDDGGYGYREVMGFVNTGR